MDRLGPFERAPRIAVACSGGPDSMALLLLVDEWTSARGGSTTAVIVDHRLRHGSAADARRAAAWARARGIEAAVLTRRDPLARGGIQAAARELRYRLLERWCHDRGVLHLALAHHREDQAETVFMRLLRGSGLDGLAAMAPVAESAFVRFLRPLLDVPRLRLVATLESRGQAYLEDPSNRDPRFLRVRIRRHLAGLGDSGLAVDRLTQLARRMRRARAALDAASAAALARVAAIFPEGYCWIDAAALKQVEEEIALRVIARAVAAVGGRVYPPRLARVERFWRALCEDRLAGGRTLGGCRIVPRRQGLLLCREPAAVSESVPARGTGLWDGRFHYRFARGAGHGGVLKCLGRDGWKEVATRRPELRRSAIPPIVRPTLPALWDLDGVVAVPHLNYKRPEVADRVPRLGTMIFAPPRPVGDVCFTSP